MSTVSKTGIKSCSCYHNSIFDHPNILAKSLIKPIAGNPSKRLKTKWYLKTPLSELHS